MKKHIIRLYHKYRNLILYGIIGSTSAGLDLLIYTLLLKAGLYYLFSHFISIHCGILCSFILNRQYNFKTKDKTLYRFLSFYVIGLTSLLLSTGMLYLMIQIMAWDKMYAKLTTIIAVAILQFILNKFITFRKIHHK
ncbi:MAG: GtrA family protein [Bacteroidales bacterium]|jgi:putative flippase GtrA|nr:GtrA family protein [Bacteroidales bacterium]